MATLTIKNIPAELYEMLKRQATVNHRSLNSEIIFTLKQVLGFREKAESDEILAQARTIREKIKISLSEEEINEAKRAGRE